MIVCRWIAKLRRRRWFLKALVKTRLWRVVRIQNPNGNPHYDLVSRIVLQPLRGNGFLYRLLVPSVTFEQAEFVLKQKVVSEKLHDILPNLVNHLAGVKESQVYCLPPEWRHLLAENGVCISNWLSRSSWFLSIARSYMLAIKAVVRMTLNTRKMPLPPLIDYAVLIELTKNASRIVAKDGSPLNSFTAWYRDSEHRLDTEKIIWSQDTAVPFQHEFDNNYLTPLIFPCLPNLGLRIRYFSVMVWRLLVAGGAILLGRWEAALLVEEAAYLENVSVLSNMGLASTYVFNNSNPVYRPLWTYKAEAMGSRILMAFYSTNCMPYNFRNGTRTAIHPVFRNLNWTHYLVWDEGQENFLREVSGERTNVRQVGIIPYSDSEAMIPQFPSNAVAVFDVSVFRMSFLAEKGLVPAYYTVKTMRLFLLECWKAITSEGKVMVLKQKRNIGRPHDREYIKMINDLSKRDGVMVLDPSIHAGRLIDMVQGVISIPYTSTSVAARLKGVPSIFYDPTKQLQNYGDELHDVPLKYSVAELSKWVKNLELRKIN